MIKIKHRVNKIIELKNTNSNLGIEVDIRSNGKNLIIHHEPFEKGEDFKEWLVHYKHKMLILNVKEEGLEYSLINLMNTANIKNYFFLDQSFPFLLKYSKEAEGRSAVRFSEYESIQSVYLLNKLCNWVWVDCFSKNPLTFKKYKQLKEYNFKICIVSPELQGRLDANNILKMKQYFEKKKIYPDAVCTKFPDLW